MSASEFMGLVHGRYDAKEEGFVPGGASLHNSMSGHGPDAATFEKASVSDTTAPSRVSDSMAFMFESRWVIRPTRFALETAQLQADYFACWEGLRKRFCGIPLSPGIRLSPNDPQLTSFVDVAIDSHFPIQNLPYGVFSTPREPVPPRGRRNR